MQIPVLRGVIERRILVNYRVDPAVLACLLPPPFEPLLVGGWGLAGVCLIRLGAVRPRGLPGWLGLRSENAAYRVAVQWADSGGVRRGVYIPRRVTGSRLNAWAGGRVFPGRHDTARFTVRETHDRYAIDLAGPEVTADFSLRAHLAEGWPGGSVFTSADEASAFFAAGSLGYSPTADPARLEGLELSCQHYRLKPLAVESLRSGYFDDPARFPPGSRAFDSALLMRGVPHEWHTAGELCCTTDRRGENLQPAGERS